MKQKQGMILKKKRNIQNKQAKLYKTKTIIAEMKILNINLGK